MDGSEFIRPSNRAAIKSKGVTSGFNFFLTKKITANMMKVFRKTLTK